MESTARGTRADRTLALTRPGKALDLVPAVESRRAWPTTITVHQIVAADALDAALRDTPQAAIGVIGRGAESTAEWLRDSGRDAVVFTLPKRKDGRQRAHARSRRPDVIVAVDWIEHEPAPGEVLQAVRALLGPEGRLVVVVPNLTHASLRLAMLLGQHPLASRRSTAAAHLFTAAGLERLLNDARFTVIGVERQVDSVDALRQLGGGVPGQVLDMLAGDADALTSHFALVAQPEGSAAVAVLHRRLRELGETQRASTRIAERLDDRVAELEVRVRHWAAETDALAAPGVPSAQALAALETRVQDLAARFDDQLRPVTTELSAVGGREAKREAALGQLAERLTARTGEIDVLIRRLEQSRYRRLIRRTQGVIARETPAGAIVAVVSRGDEALVSFDGRQGWHFPRAQSGVYAGHYPADSEAAVAHLEQLRAAGARYLLVPRTAFWWFDHYRAFHDHLLRRHDCPFRDDHTCVLFALRGASRRR